MTVYCPGWLPSPIDGVIHGQWNTARVPDKQWQLGYAWLEQGELVHVVFEGYPPGTFPPRCEGRPCFAGREPATEDVGGHDRARGMTTTLRPTPGTSPRSSTPEATCT